MKLVKIVFNNEVKAAPSRGYKYFTPKCAGKADMIVLNPEQLD
jgi:hypothetical protein